MKKISACVYMTILFVFISMFTVFSRTLDDISLLDSCKVLYSETNSDGAYLYGYTVNCLYSARILPKINIRELEITGKIRSVSQYKSKTCALVEISLDNFEVVVLNNNTGFCNYYKFNSITDLDVASFAFENDRVYFIKTDSNYSYVQSYSLNGELLYTYKFGKQLQEIFSNNSKVYARMYDGTIYRLSGESYEYVTEVDKNSYISNAGANWIYCSSNELVSLENQQKKTVDYGIVNCVVFADDKIISAENRTLYVNGRETSNINSEVEYLLAYDDCISVITNDFKWVTIEIDTLKNADNYSLDTQIEESYRINSDGILYGVESGTTISEFKQTDGIGTVYDKKGSVITSGKVKTGYSVDFNGVNRLISVRGDITGEGNVKSNDVSALMSALSEKTNLSNIQSVSADYNFDGKVNNKDLILIARKAEE